MLQSQLKSTSGFDTIITANNAFKTSEIINALQFFFTDGDWGAVRALRSPPGSNEGWCADSFAMSNCLVGRIVPADDKSGWHDCQIIGNVQALQM